eukprot:352421-Chlamydomonas_euryale.AAC.41
MRCARDAMTRACRDFQPSVWMARVAACSTALELALPSGTDQWPRKIDLDRSSLERSRLSSRQPQRPTSGPTCCAPIGRDRARGVHSVLARDCSTA